LFMPKIEQDSFSVKDNRKLGFSIVNNELVEVFGPVVGVMAFAVYVVLVKYADNSTQECYPSHETIGEKLNISRSSVIRAIKELEHQELISITAVYAADKSRSSNLYTLLDIKDKPARPPLEGNRYWKTHTPVSPENTPCVSQTHKLDSPELDSDPIIYYVNEDVPATPPLPSPEAVKDVIQADSLTVEQPKLYTGSGTIADPAVFKKERLVVMPPRPEEVVVEGLSLKAQFQAKRDQSRERAGDLLRLLDRCENASPRCKLVARLPEPEIPANPRKVNAADILISYIKSIYEVDAASAAIQTNSMLKQLRGVPWKLYEAIGESTRHEVEGDIFHYLWGIIRKDMVKAGISSLPNKPAAKTETTQIKKLKEQIVLPNGMNYAEYLENRRRWLAHCDAKEDYVNQSRAEIVNIIETLEKLVAFYGTKSKAA
jgi:DNA-binding Lrp family transcriptional regulator